jgi:predicted phage terminase large subunit-like protein
MKYDGVRRTTSIGWTDPRTQEGELLCPQRFDEKDTATLEKTLGSYAFAGQFQQRPTPRGGGMLKNEWMRFWYDPMMGVPEHETTITEKGETVEIPQREICRLDEGTRTASWDLAFKGGEKNDFVVGQVWARGDRENRGNFYLVDQERGQYDFPATIAALRRLRDRSPCYTTLVEEKANGAAVIASMASEVPGLIAVLPQGGKEARAAAIAPLFEAGNVWLPHPQQFPWVKTLVEELVNFPRAHNDDQVDALTQALTRMVQRQADVVDMGGYVNPNGNAPPALWQPSPWGGA